MRAASHAIQMKPAARAMNDESGASGSTAKAMGLGSVSYDEAVQRLTPPENEGAQTTGKPKGVGAILASARVARHLKIPSNKLGYPTVPRDDMLPALLARVNADLAKAWPGAPALTEVPASEAEALAWCQGLPGWQASVHDAQFSAGYATGSDHDKAMPNLDGEVHHATNVTR